MKHRLPAPVLTLPARTAAPGFTLVELLVSMAITSVLMVALLSFVGTFSESYTQTQRSLNTLSQARSFIQFFDRELSTRLPGTPLIHEVEATAVPPESSDKIAFIRTLTLDEENTFANQSPPEPGDLGTSLYYVAYSDDPRFAPTYHLYRRSLGPEKTQLLLEQEALNTATPPAFPTSQPADGEPIVSNILNFLAKPKYRDPTDGQLKDWIATAPLPPALIELEITFLDEAVAARYTTQSEWNRLASTPRESELRFIRTFTRTIAIAK